jgi:HEPN domain-containing protein
MPDRTVLAEEWFERGSSDLRAARRSFDAADYTTTLAVLIHQAVEKYLKGFLIVHGWKLKKTHNLVELVSEAVQYGAAFEPFLAFARSATVYYLDDRYPGQRPPQYLSGEMEEALGNAQDLIRRIENSMRSCDVNE